MNYPIRDIREPWLFSFGGPERIMRQGRRVATHVWRRRGSVKKDKDAGNTISRKKPGKERKI